MSVSDSTWFRCTIISVHRMSGHPTTIITAAPARMAGYLYFEVSPSDLPRHGTTGEEGSFIVIHEHGLGCSVQGYEDAPACAYRVPNLPSWEELVPACRQCAPAKEEELVFAEAFWLVRRPANPHAATVFSARTPADPRPRMIAKIDFVRPKVVFRSVHSMTVQAEIFQTRLRMEHTCFLIFLCCFLSNRYIRMRFRRNQHYMRSNHPLVRDFVS